MEPKTETCVRLPYAYLFLVAPPVLDAPPRSLLRAAGLRQVQQRQSCGGPQPRQVPHVEGQVAAPVLRRFACFFFARRRVQPWSTAQDERTPFFFLRGEARAAVVNSPKNGSLWKKEREQVAQESEKIILFQEKQSKTPRGKQRCFEKNEEWLQRSEKNSPVKWKSGLFLAGLSVFGTGEERYIMGVREFFPDSASPQQQIATR